MWNIEHFSINNLPESPTTITLTLSKDAISIDQIKKNQ